MVYILYFGLGFGPTRCPNMLERPDQGPNIDWPNKGPNIESKNGLAIWPKTKTKKGLAKTKISQQFFPCLLSAESISYTQLIKNLK